MTAISLASEKFIRLVIKCYPLQFQARIAAQFRTTKASMLRQKVKYKEPSTIKSIGGTNSKEARNMIWCALLNLTIRIE